MGSEYGRHILRTDSSNDWKNTNPLLRLGEIVADFQQRKLKLGDGTSRYNDLPYMYDELYMFINALVRIIAKININGKLLESVDNVYTLRRVYKNANAGDICFVTNSMTFYYYDGEYWSQITEDVNNTHPVKDLTELNNISSNINEGTLVYVQSEKHFYFFDGNEWKKLRNYNDDFEYIVSVDELSTKCSNPRYGQIVYILSKKQHYFYDGLEWKPLLLQLG